MYIFIWYDTYTRHSIMYNIIYIVYRKSALFRHFLAVFSLYREL